MGEPGHSVEAAGLNLSSEALRQGLNIGKKPSITVKLLAGLERCAVGERPS